MNDTVDGDKSRGSNGDGDDVDVGDDGNDEDDGNDCDSTPEKEHCISILFSLLEPKCTSLFSSDRFKCSGGLPPAHYGGYGRISASPSKPLELWPDSTKY